MITALLFVASLLLVVVAAELFTNAIEWAGYLLNLGTGATGSLLAALGSCIFFGLAPAWRTVRTDFVSALKTGGESASGKRRTFGRKGRRTGVLV